MSHEKGSHTSNNIHDWTGSDMCIRGAGLVDANGKEFTQNFLDSTPQD